MRISVFLIIIVMLIACDPFNPKRIDNSQSQLKNIFNEAVKQGLTQVESNQKNDIAKIMRNYSIDKLSIVYNDSSNMVGKDSIVIFTKNSGSFWTPQKNIIFDFALKPRNFGNQDYPNAAYHLEQINERWYFETIGFD